MLLRGYSVAPLSGFRGYPVASLRCALRGYPLWLPSVAPLRGSPPWLLSVALRCSLPLPLRGFLVATEWPANRLTPVATHRVYSVATLRGYPPWPLRGDSVTTPWLPRGYPPWLLSVATPWLPSSVATRRGYPPRLPSVATPLYPEATFRGHPP